MDAERGFWAGFAGDVDAPRSALAACDEPGHTGDAWRAALDGLLFHLEDGWKAPWAACLANRSRLDPRGARGAALAADMAGRAAFLAFDAARHAEAAVAVARVAAGAGELGGLLVSLAEVRAAALDGRSGELVARAAELESRASDGNVAALVVEAAAFRALGLLSVDVEEAVGTARRAARMARTESLPLPEYLANVVLARARRMSDRPHLAVQILTALARLAPEPWLPWLGWELSFAGAGDTAERLLGDGGGDAMPALSSLHAATRAAAQGDRARFEDAIARAREATAGARPLLHELDAFALGVDPDADPSAAPGPLAPWCRGEIAALPLGLLGIALHPRADADDILAYVVARPDRAVRRVFGSGAGFAPGVTHSSRPGRTETALSVLALSAGRQIDKPEFFRSVYGFAYRRELHQGPLEVLIHRLRKATAGLLEIERGEERIAATILAPFSVPDPRCTKPLDERLLRALAEHGGGSAKEVATALGVSLRTVQGVIRQLTDDGACIADRQGRKVVYRVEDTTFSEPTRQHTRRRIL